MKRLCILTWTSVLLALAVFWQSRPATTIRPGKGLLMDRAWLAPSTTTLTPKEQHRAPDQTFLTYPEWFLVFGPAEFAESLQHRTATSFPLMTHVFQIWEGYNAIDDQTLGVFPPNDEYHTMIRVIATSSTLEFGLKAMYESVIGRLTDIGNGEIATDEDRFYAAYAKDYVTFLDTAPWYEYDFITQLRHLWLDQSWVSGHMLRKWERRYFLTTELAVKALYGKVIEQATHSAYERPILSTSVVLDRTPGKLPADFKILTPLADGRILAQLPRYTPFTPIAIDLAKQGIQFEEIAGNRTAIMITAIGPSDAAPTSPACRLLFRQTIPTHPGQSRWGLATPVTSLSETLRTLSIGPLTVEHVFDF